MDINAAPTDSASSLAEFDVSEQPRVNIKIENVPVDAEKIDATVDQSDIANEYLDSNPIQIKVINEESISLAEKTQSDFISDSTDDTETAEVVLSAETFDSGNVSNKPLSISNNISIKDVEVDISSSQNDIEISNDSEIINSNMGPDVVQHVGNIDDQRNVFIRNESCIKEKDASLQDLIETTVDNLQDGNSSEKIMENNECNMQNQESIIECITEDNNTDLSKSDDIQVSEVNIGGNTAAITPEIILEGIEFVQDNVVVSCENTELDEEKSIQEIETIEEHVEAMHGTVLEKENIEVIIEHEFPIITQEVSVESKEIPLITNDNVYDKEGDENITAKNEEEIVTESVESTVTIEEQMSNIEQEDGLSPKTEEPISIAEAISRDFDETDTEDVDRSENTTEVQTLEVSHDNVMVGVSINDQLQHGTVTVTDTSGQIYYVQSVEDLIVVENDIPATLDQSETIEVTVLSESDEPDQTETTVVKQKKKPPIPSHILGRNIENPVIDTFRNGKIPPKPRLGVKIPYKNLTSQIVSKDEIAKEILDRQKQKYKQAGQTTREILFTQRLTQRLAKKIAPTSASSNSSELTHVKTKDEAINNSDLLAILEGDGEDSETKRIQESKMITASNVDSPGAANTNQNVLPKTDAERKAKAAPMSKMAEREIALKQLNELPVGPRRRKGGLGMFGKRTPDESALQITVIENEMIIEDEPASLPQNEKQDLGKLKYSKIQEEPKLIQSKAESTKVITTTTQPIETNNDKHESSQKTTTITKPEQSQSRPDEIKQITPITKLGIVNPKINETGEAVANADIKLGQTETTEGKPDDTHKKNLHAVSKTEQTETQGKKKDAEKTLTPQATISNTTETTIASKTIEIKPIEKAKKMEIPKIVCTKVAENIKVIGPLKDEFIARKHTGNPPVKTYTRKRKSTEDISVVSSLPDKKPAVIQKETSVPPNTYITKSSRIIKRKVIWDPDEPSTTKSLASKSPKTEHLKSEKSTKPESNVSKVDRKPVPKPMVKSDIIRSPTKTPDSQKAKKRLSEVDRLLMDEGAVNMLYAFKNVDDAIKKKKAGVISLDKAQRELMNKTNELKKDLKTNSDKISPKSLRRKDSPVPTPTKKIIPASVSRKKSKDSNRSSLHSPPASPSMMYLNHAEASRIIRRHSSSSYSSMEGDFDVDKKAETESAIGISTDSEKNTKKRLASIASENMKSKKTKRSSEKDNATVTETDKGNEDTPQSINKLTENEQPNTLKYEKYKTFSVKEIDRMVQIILLPSFNNEAYLTPEVSVATNNSRAM